MSAIVIGSGFGGLGAALTLARAGVDVLVLESLTYPGGCASTFTRGGSRFDAGATVSAGFGPGQLFRRWTDDLGLSVEPVPLRRAVELRTHRLTLEVPTDREAFGSALAALPGAPSAGVQAFLATQGRISDALWPLFSEPDLLPPLSVASVASHARRAGAYLPVARALGRTVEGVLGAHGVADFGPLRLAVDAALQITVQTDARRADAIIGLSAMDFWFRNPAHIRGGMGSLADALVGSIRALGGRISFADRAKSIHSENNEWVVTHRRGTTRAPLVVANVLPSALGGLLETPPPQLAPLQARVEQGWGACALFLVLEDRGLPPEAFHLQLVDSQDAALIEGNHLLVSVSAADEVDRAGPGRRVATVSTHTRMPATKASVERVQARMRDTLAALAPELSILSATPASPRTYARFTGRPGGWVGGPPKTRSFANYTGAFPGPVLPGLYMVGDTHFPGQSTLAAAVGGHRVATQAMRALQHLAYSQDTRKTA